VIKIVSGSQTGEWALVQEEQMGEQIRFSHGKNFTKQINMDNKH